MAENAFSSQLNPTGNAPPRPRTGAVATEGSPLQESVLLELFDHLDDILQREDCDHTLRYSEAFLLGRPVDVEHTTAWLCRMGAHCDCEVLLNVARDVYSGFSTSA